MPQRGDSRQSPCWRFGGRSYRFDDYRSDHLTLANWPGLGRIQFTSMMGRIETSIEFYWNGSWPRWVEFGRWPYQDSAGFGSNAVCEVLSLSAPHWLFVLVAGAATWRLMWPSYRFSLRTLLALTAAVAILMGAWTLLDRQFLPQEWIEL
jgi:hypothetical protein